MGSKHLVHRILQIFQVFFTLIPHGWALGLDESTPSEQFETAWTHLKEASRSSSSPIDFQKRTSLTDNLPLQFQSIATLLVRLQSSALPEDLQRAHRLQLTLFERLKQSPFYNLDETDSTPSLSSSWKDIAELEFLLTHFFFQYASHRGQDHPSEDHELISILHELILGAWDYGLQALDSSWQQWLESPTSSEKISNQETRDLEAWTSFVRTFLNGLGLSFDQWDPSLHKLLLEIQLISFDLYKKNMTRCLSRIARGSWNVSEGIHRISDLETPLTIHRRLLRSLLFLTGRQPLRQAHQEDMFILSDTLLLSERNWSGALSRLFLAEAQRDEPTTQNSTLLSNRALRLIRRESTWLMREAGLNPWTLGTHRVVAAVADALHQSESRSEAPSSLAVDHSSQALALGIQALQYWRQFQVKAGDSEETGRTLASFVNTLTGQIQRRAEALINKGHTRRLDEFETFFLRAWLRILFVDQPYDKQGRTRVIRLASSLPGPWINDILTINSELQFNLDLPGSDVSEAGPLRVDFRILSEALQSMATLVAQTPVKQQHSFLIQGAVARFLNPAFSKNNQRLQRAASSLFSLSGSSKLKTNFIYTSFWQSPVSTRLQENDLIHYIQLLSKEEAAEIFRLIGSQRHRWDYPLKFYEALARFQDSNTQTMASIVEVFLTVEDPKSLSDRQRTARNIFVSIIRKRITETLIDEPRGIKPTWAVATGQKLIESLRRQAERYPSSHSGLDFDLNAFQDRFLRSLGRSFFEPIGNHTEPALALRPEYVALMVQDPRSVPRFLLVQAIIHGWYLQDSHIYSPIFAELVDAMEELRYSRDWDLAQAAQKFPIAKLRLIMKLTPARFDHSESLVPLAQRIFLRLIFPEVFSFCSLSLEHKKIPSLE